MVARVHDDMSLGTWRRDRGTIIRRAASTTTSIGPTSEHPAPHVIVAESETTGAPTEWPPHSHPMHELVWARGGTLTSRIGNHIFTVPPGLGLWLPAGVVHGGRLTAAAQLHNAFFAPDRTPVAFAEPTSIAMTPLLESLLGRLMRTDLDAAARVRTETVVFDVLDPADRQFALELPGDPRIDVIAEALLDDPSDGRGLLEWASLLGVSDRTITRTFRETTGLSFAQWRQALRIHRALTLLSEGTDVCEVSERLGYSQPSTFIAAFRRVMKVTPGALALRG